MRVAVIREEDCVGCTKCLPACPVDAIVGASKFLHTVLTKECIGCELCVAPCPMDCIEMVTVPIEETQEERKTRAYKAKFRFQAQQERRQREKPLQLFFDPKDPKVRATVQQDIQEAFARVQKKRTSKDDSVEMKQSL